VLEEFDMKLVIISDLFVKPEQDFI